MRMRTGRKRSSGANHISTLVAILAGVGSGRGFRWKASTRAERRVQHLLLGDVVDPAVHAARQRQREVDAVADAQPLGLASKHPGELDELAGRVLHARQALAPLAVGEDDASGAKTTLTRRSSRITTLVSSS